MSISIGAPDGAQRSKIERFDDPRTKGPVERNENCFYCYKKLSYPAIGWHGAQSIVMHYQCALDLSVRLIRDYHEAECLESSRVATINRAKKFMQDYSI